MPTQIFISYRRNDTGGHAGRFWDKLQQYTRPGALFYDKSKIDSGEDFPQYLNRAVLEARAVLVLIGPDWASQENLERLHEKDGKADFVRRETALALTRHAAGAEVAAEVIPVLLDGTTMPDAALLPADLAGLCALNAHPFAGNDADWQNQFAGLLERLKTIPGVEIAEIEEIKERRRFPYRSYGIMALIALVVALGYAVRNTAHSALDEAHGYLRMARYDLAAQELQKLPWFLAWWPGLEFAGEKAQLGLDFTMPKQDQGTLVRRLKKLLESHPVDSDLMVLQAAQSWRDNDLQEVQKLADAAFRADPKNAEARFLHGLASDRLGDRAGAEGDYLEASELAPKSPQYLGNYAAKLLNRGAYADAITNYRQINGYPLARLEEAKAHWALGDFTAAAGGQRDALKMLDEVKNQNDLNNRRAWVFYLADLGVLLPVVDEKRCYAELSLAAGRSLSDGELFPVEHCALLENRKHLRDLLADDLCRYIALPRPDKAAAVQVLRARLGVGAGC